MISICQHHVTCPQAIARDNHRHTLTSIWRSREWRNVTQAYKARHPAKCSRCGKEGSIIPGHCAEDYLDIPSYIQKVREDRAIPLCPRCNQQEAKGKHPCPACIMKHAADPAHWIRYIRQGEEICFHCEYPGKRKRERPNKHPCARNQRQQKCKTRLVCPYSPRKAENCDYFVRRGVRI